MCTPAQSACDDRRVPEYDAFGREIGEDSLAGLRGGGAETAERPEPRPSTAFPEHRDVPSAPPRSGSGVLRVVRVVVALVVLGVVASIGVAVYAVVDSVQDGVEIVDDAFDAATVPGIPREAEEALQDATKGAGEDSSAPAAEPKGLARGSMLTRAELSRALDRLRPYGRLRLLRVAPERVDAQMVTSAGKLTLVQIRPGAAPQVISTSSSSGGGPGLVPLSAVNPAAPFRLTRSAAGRLRKPTTQVDYAVLLDFAGTPQWSVFFKGGRAFQGDGSGRVIRRIQ